jgi:hypothetical protein
MLHPLPIALIPANAGTQEGVEGETTKDTKDTKARNCARIVSMGPW